MIGNIIKIMNLISGISSILAIGLLSPVQSILLLIILFLSTAICLYQQGFMLIGILYILIYVGAIAILFLFILSLLKIEYIEQGSISPLILTILLICLLPLDILNNSPAYSGDMSSASRGHYETDNIIEEVSTVWNELTIVGNQFYTEYAVLLILVGLILILSVIGAISITR